jgi:pimeloyl-ACP methyl ester carboxylesterase
MTPHEFAARRQKLKTDFGNISYVENGAGPAALFIHGIPMNGYHWRHQIEALGDIRRCIAPDSMGLGYSEVSPDQSLSFESQALMLIDFMDRLAVQDVDLVGNDSGGAIAQILATRIPHRIRSLTLTNCDAHDNWPPAAFMPLVERARAGQLGQTFAALLANPDAARSRQGLGVAFQFPERLTDEVLDVYLGPIAASRERQSLVDTYAAVMDCGQTLRIHEALKVFDKPTLVVWGDDDVFFPERWAHWLKETIPGVRELKILRGARLFFPEERSDDLNALLRAHWSVAAPG